jgi:hypothetical protein
MSELIQLSKVGDILSNTGNKLIKNQNILRCLKYDTSDALMQTGLNIDDIIKLIGKGNDSITQQRIFNTPFNDNIADSVKTELRYFIPILEPNNLFLSEIIITFQLIIHNTLWELDNNQSRPIILIHEILKDFNGYDIGSIGELYLEGAIRMVTWNQNFSGYQINMKTRTK